MVELLSDYKDLLKTNHKYSEELAENIAVLADSMIEYYGEDYRNLIYDAIDSCKFSVEKEKKSGKMQSVEDILISEDSLSEVKELPLKDDLRSKTVAYGAKPVITCEDGKFKIGSVNRTMAISSRFSWENPESLNNLAVETDRLINSYINGYEISGKNLLVREGLSTRIEALSESNGKITRQFKSENGIGLETGVNLYSALSITRRNYFTDYDASNFDENRLTAGVLMDGAGLSEVIAGARITKDTEELKSILGEDYEKLISTLDRIYSQNVARKRALGDSEQLSSLNKEIEEIFSSTLAPIVSKISAKYSLEEVSQNVLR